MGARGRSGRGLRQVEPQSLLSIDDGKTVEIKGLKPGELTLGWTSDGQLYVVIRGRHRRRRKG